MKNASFGNESRLQQRNMLKTIGKSETGREDASCKLKDFTEKVIQDNNSIKYNNMSLCKKADNKVIRIRGKDLKKKRICKKRTILPNAVLMTYSPGRGYEHIF